MPIVLRELEVVRTRRVTPRLTRITLSGRQLQRFDRNGVEQPPFRTSAPDDHVRLVLPDPGTGRLVLPEQRDGHLKWPKEPAAIHRDYTVRRFDPDAGTYGELDLDFVLHGHGIASRWAAGARVGDPLHLAGPRGSNLPRTTADRWVLVADETGLPAVARFLDEHGDTREIHAIVLVEVADEEQPELPGVTWLHRRSAPGRTPVDDAELVADAVGALSRAATAPERGWGWAAGERATVRAVRDVFRSHLGLVPEQMRTVAYWDRRTAPAGQNGNGPAGRGTATPSTDDAARAQLRRLTDMVTPWAIRVAVTVGVVDAIASGTSEPDAVADTTGTHPGAVATLMWHLARAGILLESGGRFRLSRTGELLVAGTPAHRILDLHGGAGHIDRAWAGLEHTVRTGGPGFDTVFGAPFWDVIHSDPERTEDFDAYLADTVASWAPGVITHLDRLGARRIADVGGGNGTFLASALDAARERTGVVVEREHTATGARRLLAARGLDDRGGSVVGDFFDPLPADFDVYLLAQVLHDWPDRDAVKILSRCAEAAGATGTVLVVERLDDDREHSHMQLMMRNLFGSHERTRDQLSELAGRAGLRTVDVRPVGDELHLMQLTASD